MIEQVMEYKKKIHLILRLEIIPFFHEWWQGLCDFKKVKCNLCSAITNIYTLCIDFQLLHTSKGRNTEDLIIGIEPDVFSNLTTFSQNGALKGKVESWKERKWGRREEVALKVDGQEV